MFEETIAIIQDQPLPKMFRAKQVFPHPVLPVEEIPWAIKKQLSNALFEQKIQPGMRIAITAGSRGIANIALITKSIVDFVYSRGAKPVVVPAMGSHGNATARGQLEVLHGYGITEEYLGCPIHSSMEVKQVGYTKAGEAVFIDKFAAESDGIIVSCRVKPHTSFRGPFESGIMKMMAIGLGKQQGAEACHRAGFKYMAKQVPAFGQTILDNAPVLFAVATLENAFDETYRIEVVDSKDVHTREPELLKETFANMPRIHFDSCDVLIVDRIGKNYSGGGMDPNITGAPPSPWLFIEGGFKAHHTVVLGLSEESHGNGMGLGYASVTTRRLVEKLNLDAMYSNAVTCKVFDCCNIPVHFNTDEQAIQAALKICVDHDSENPRIIRIPNSLHVEHIMLSEAYYEEAKRHPNLIIESEPEPFPFDEEGFLPYDLDVYER